MNSHSAAAAAADIQPLRNNGTMTPTAFDTESMTKSHEEKPKSKEPATKLQPKPKKASLYQEMQLWQDKLEPAIDAWVYEDIKEPIEQFIREPGLPPYYRMVALLARCLPEPESEDGEEEADGREMDLDEQRRYFMTEAKKAYEECLKVYNRPWDLESVEEAWSTWPN